MFGDRNQEAFVGIYSRGGGGGTEWKPLDPGDESATRRVADSSELRVRVFEVQRGDLPWSAVVDRSSGDLAKDLRTVLGALRTAGHKEVYRIDLTNPRQPELKPTGAGARGYGRSHAVPSAACRATTRAGDGVGARDGLRRRA